MNKDDEKKIKAIKKSLKKEKIKHIYLTFVDFSGNILTKMVGVKELINNTHVSWFDGISINGRIINDFKNDKNSDWLVLIPDPQSFRILPFIEDSNQKSAMIMCNIKNYPLDTRSVLEKATNEAIEIGFCPIAGTQLIYGTSYNKTSQDYYKTLATSKSTEFNNTLVNSLLSSNIDIEYYMPYGKDHYRIDLVPDVILNSADKLFTSKWFCENLSELLDFKINYDNLPDSFLSTCPVHLSLWRGNREKNLFFDTDDEYELSKIGKDFIRGILYHSKYIKAVISATTQNDLKAYKNTYSVERDNSIIQVPLYFKEKLKKDRIGWSKRMIYQGINSDCNYYLVFASLLYAGLFGLKNTIVDSKLNQKTNNYTTQELINEVKHNTYFEEKFGTPLTNEIIKRLEKNENQTEFCLFKADAKRVIWEVTKYCNYNCKHCCASASNVDTSKELNLEDFKRVLDEIKQFGVKEIYFSGGEPFSRPDMLDILRKARSNNILCNISTNGSLITEKIAKELSSLEINKVHISLDSHDEKTFNYFRGGNYFENTVNKIKLLRKHNIYVRVGAVIWSQNIDYLEDMIKYLINIDVNEVVFNWLVKVGRLVDNNDVCVDISRFDETVEKIRYYMEKYKDNIKISMHRNSNFCDSDEICPAGEKLFYIDPYGNVSPCSWIKKLDKDFTSNTNLKNKTFLEIINSKKMNDFNEMKYSRKEKFGTGCPAICKERNTTYFSKDPLLKK